jgi:protein-S-isoprenylcysteine O-methyltransferase Ste14
MAMAEEAEGTERVRGEREASPVAGPKGAGSGKGTTSDGEERTAAQRPSLNASGKKRLLVVFLGVAFYAAVIFAAAGTVHVPRAWLYLGVCYAYFAVAIPLMLRRYPEVVELVNQRGERKQGTKGWDRWFAAVYVLSSMLVTPLVAGWDFTRGGPSLGAGWAAAGCAALVLAWALFHWAMVYNRFLETSARIQRERGQTVVTTGPYAHVRHPGYISIIVQALSFPLVMGSPVTFVPALVSVLAVVARTALEDRMLREELDGYREYAERVRWRLVPGVW